MLAPPGRSTGHLTSTEKRDGQEAAYCMQKVQEQACLVALFHCRDHITARQSGALRARGACSAYMARVSGVSLLARLCWLTSRPPLPRWTPSAASDKGGCRQGEGVVVHKKESISQGASGQRTQPERWARLVFPVLHIAAAQGYWPARRATTAANCWSWRSVTI